MSSPDTYREWEITWEYGQFWGVHPDYDASYEGEEDGWVDNGLRLSARTLPLLEAEIDAKELEMEVPNVQPQQRPDQTHVARPRREHRAARRLRG